MFTGIVEAVGTLTEVKTAGAGFRVRIHTALGPAMKLGDSLAVNGVCLTVILIDGEHVLADVGPETARVTTFGALQRGQTVNLELKRFCSWLKRFGGGTWTAHLCIIKQQKRFDRLTSLIIHF